MITKVLLPRRRQGSVPRRRLVDFLHRHLDRRLQLVVAPPGYGKTTLLVDFAHEAREQGVPVCWLSLDEADADAASFFEHLVLSLRQQFPGFGKRTAALLRGIDNPAREQRAIATALANEIAEQVDDFFLLVLDDYHAVATSVPVNSAVDWLLQRLPEGCHVILGGRTIPTRLDLAALASRLEVAGLGITDLRFRAEEAAELIRVRDGHGVHPREADRAVTRAEGWVTAIVLSLHAEETARFSGLLRAKTQHEPVYGYLATQVFGRLSPELQQFLTESAVLPSLSAPECDAVLERQDSAEQLATLVQMSLFVEPLERATERGGPAAGAEEVPDDDAPDEGSVGVGWLRYHQLWREFLLDRLTATAPERAEALHRRAAEWAAARGRPDEAVEHLLALGSARGEWSPATNLLLELAEPELARGRAARLLAWIERLPEATVDAAALLHYYAARALYRLDRARESLARAEHGEQVASTYRRWEDVFLARAWRAEMLARLGQGDKAVTMLVELFDQFNRQPRPGELRVRLEKEACFTFMLAGRYREAIAHGTVVLEHLRQVKRLEERHHLAALVNNVLGNCHAHLRGFGQADLHYRKAEQLWRQLGNRTSEAGVLNGIAMLRMRSGQPLEAEAAFLKGIAIAEKIGHLRAQVTLRNNLARCQRERGALQEAEQTIKLSLPMARQIDEAWHLAEALQESGHIMLHLGRSSEAIRALEVAQDVAAESWPAGLALCQALLALAQARSGLMDDARQSLGTGRHAISHVRAPDERLRCSVALVAAAAALQSEKPPVAELRATRRWARDNERQPAFFAECARYQETARLLLAERLLPEGVAGTMQEALSREVGAFVEPPRQAVLQAVPRLASATRFQIRLLGTPSLMRDAEHITVWRTNLVRELLFFLVLRAGSVVRSEAIVDALMPDADYDRSLTTLRHAVHHLRGMFRPLNPVRTTRGGYCFELDEAIHCDVQEIRDLLQVERPSRTAPDAEALAAALRLYRGDLLEGLDADWVVQPRAELERQFLAAAQALLGEHERHERHEAAIALAERVLRVDPFHEPFHLALLRHQMILGHVAAARQHFRHYCQVMREAFDRGPDPEIARLLAPPAG